ncbi:MAG TPA: hypothetical protein VF800_24325 [Telluria sp.]
MSNEPINQGNLESRVARLEDDVAVIKIDVAVIKANGATKTDLNELRFELSAQIVKAQGEMLDRLGKVQVELAAQIEKLRSDVVATVNHGRLATVLWVISVVFFAQFLPAIAKLVKEISGQ